MNVPYFGGSFWTRYNLIDDPCKTAGAALGLVYVGRRAGDSDNSYDLPSYSRWDSALYFRWHSLDFRFYAENMFDVYYIASSRNPERNLPGAPFHLRGTVALVY